ncbi:MAG: DUF4426 domain-containing protein [Lysobacter sp.]
MRTPNRMLAVLAMSLLLAACGAEPPARTAENSPVPQEAIARVGDVTMRANVMQTSTLGPGVASQYGISRDDNTVMLLVAVRQGVDAEEVALPAQVTATATDLRGQRQTIVLRELRAGALLDYVGTVQTTLPETLRFDVKIVRAGGATSSMQFTREFYPR